MIVLPGQEWLLLRILMSAVFDTALDGGEPRFPEGWMVGGLVALLPCLVRGRTEGEGRPWRRC